MWRHSKHKWPNMQAKTQTRNLHGHQTGRQRQIGSHSQSDKWGLRVVRRQSCSVNYQDICILTLHRLQKWNSSFSAACRLMDSSESGNSLLNGASTCFTYADWACVCVRMCVRESERVCSCVFPPALSSAPAASANVPCLFLCSHAFFTNGGRNGERMRQEGGMGWREGCWPCQSPREPGG